MCPVYGRETGFSAVRRAATRPAQSRAARGTQRGRRLPPPRHPLHLSVTIKAPAISLPVPATAPVQAGRQTSPGRRTAQALPTLQSRTPRLRHTPEHSFDVFLVRHVLVERFLLAV